MKEFLLYFLRWQTGFVVAYPTMWFFGTFLDAAIEYHENEKDI